MRIASTNVLKFYWQIQKTGLNLSNNEVHLWHAKLDQSYEWIKKLTHVLSSEEKKRAERFHFDKDRKRFIVTHGVLRTILSLYLDVEPSCLQIGCQSHGKPYVVEKLNDEEICFNLTHSHSLLLFAFTRSRQIGVDIEYVRPIPEADQIVARFFSPNEHAMWQQLSEDQKQQAFFNCWTCKEAYIKAIGEGLSMPLDQFDVSFAIGKQIAFLSAKETSDRSYNWLFRAIQPDPGYIAALVVEGCSCQLEYWELIF